MAGLIASLPLFHQVAGSRIVVVGSGPMAEAKRRLVERAGAVPVGEAEAHHASLAFVALEDAGEAAAVRQRLKAKGLLVNVADKPNLCDFTTPSILDRDPLLIATLQLVCAGRLAEREGQPQLDGHPLFSPLALDSAGNLNR